MSTSHWTLDKKIPAALLLAIAMQTLAAVWWAATINGRVNALEKESANNNIAALQERVVRLEVIIKQVDDTTTKIERKLDRLPVLRQ